MQSGLDFMINPDQICCLGEMLQINELSRMFQQFVLIQLIFRYPIKVSLGAFE